MKQINIKLVGTGSFGSFMFDFLGKHPKVNFTTSSEAEHVLMAVPYSAYENVASRYRRHYHLINVCSIQEPTNEICNRYSDKVTGIHPMFGEKSGSNNRVCLVTQAGSYSQEIIRVFNECGARIVNSTPSGELITGEWHDRLMAKSHIRALQIAEIAKPLLKDIDSIEDEYLPVSVQKLRALIKQLDDMTEGTRTSINANKYIIRKEN